MRFEDQFLFQGRFGGDLKLASLTKRIQQIIVITKLTLVFEVYDSSEAALHSFKK